MFSILLVLCVSFLVSSTDATCKTTGGKPCVGDHPHARVEKITKEQPCFKYDEKDTRWYCFTSKGNNGVGRCDCTTCDCSKAKPPAKPTDVCTNVYEYGFKTCNANNPNNERWDAAPCVRDKRNNRDFCFVDATGYNYQFCDCSRPVCKCGAYSDRLKCDNSIVPKKTSCSAEKNKYCEVSKSNTMCNYCGVDVDKCGNEICARGITDEKEKAELVDLHNELRRKVANGTEKGGKPGKEGQPSAANMNELVWDDEVAKMSQTWVDQCNPPGHDPNRNMVYTWCGQNYWLKWKGIGPFRKKSLAAAVKDWYSEVKNFDNAAVPKFGQGSHTGVVGHYTQVIWADVTKIGCGYMYRWTGKYRGTFEENITCNYCKGANMKGAAIYKTGTPGSACPAGRKNNKGLCKA